MNYKGYLDFISKNGTMPWHEKMPSVQSMLIDDYMRRALVTKLLTENIIDENLGKILLTKSLITEYL